MLQIIYIVNTFCLFEDNNCIKSTYLILHTDVPVSEIGYYEEDESTLVCVYLATWYVHSIYLCHFVRLTHLKLLQYLR